MKRTSKMLIVGASVLAIGAGGASAAIGSSQNDAAEQVSGPSAESAKAAALQITHGGTANSVERDSENGATWEVEVTKPDGNTVDARLGQNYDLVVVEGDSENQ